MEQIPVDDVPVNEMPKNAHYFRLQFVALIDTVEAAVRINKEGISLAAKKKQFQEFELEARNIFVDIMSYLRDEADPSEWSHKEFFQATNAVIFIICKLKGDTVLMDMSSKPESVEKELSSLALLRQQCNDVWDQVDALEL